MSAFLVTQTIRLRLLRIFARYWSAIYRIWSLIRDLFIMCLAFCFYTTFHHNLADDKHVIWWYNFLKIKEKEEGTKKKQRVAVNSVNSLYDINLAHSWMAAVSTFSKAWHAKHNKWFCWWKGVMFLPLSLCLFACPLDHLKSYERILMKFFEGWGVAQPIFIWWRSESRFGSRVPPCSKLWY